MCSVCTALDTYSEVKQKNGEYIRCLTLMEFLISVCIVPKNSLSQQATAICLSSERTFKAEQPFVSNFRRSVLTVPRTPVTDKCSPFVSTFTVFGTSIFPTR